MSDQDRSAAELTERGLVPILFGLSNRPVFERFAVHHRARNLEKRLLAMSYGNETWVPRWVAIVLLLSPAYLARGEELTPAGSRVANLLAELEADPELQASLLSAEAMGGTEAASALLLELSGDWPKAGP